MVCVCLREGKGDGGEATLRLHTAEVFCICIIALDATAGSKIEWDYTLVLSSLEKIVSCRH